MEAVEVLTTWEVGELLYGPLIVPEGVSVDEVRLARKRRLQKTGAEIRRMRRRMPELVPLEGRAGDAQLLWPGAAMRAAVAARPGRGNRLRGELRRGTRSGDPVA